MMLLLREHYPIQKLCEVLGVPRSSAYYEPRPGEDRALSDPLIEVAGRWPTYGYRRLTKQLQREGHAVNFKRVRRLMHELGLMLFFDSCALVFDVTPLVMGRGSYRSHNPGATPLP
jgi:putative transposase